MENEIMNQNSLQDFRLGSSDSLANSSSAPVTFVQALQHQVNEQDIQALIQSQKHMLVRFEKTNEMLVNCNALMAARFNNSSKELKHHIHFLVEMKKDLDYVFRRIRFLKMKLSQQYPDSFSACHNVFSILDEEEEPEGKQPEAVASSSGSSPSPPATSPSTSDTG